MPDWQTGCKLSAIPEFAIISLLTVLEISRGVPILRESKRLILRELEGRKLHGYDLAKKLNLPLTGIYQHLRDLTEDGLIVSQAEGRRKIYCLTKRGEALLMLLEDTGRKRS